MQSKIGHFDEIRLRRFSDAEEAAISTSPLAGTAQHAEFRVAALGDCPAVFCVAKPICEADAPFWRIGWRIAGGRGLDPITAFYGCAGEVAERMSLMSRGGDDSLVSETRQSGRRANDFLKFSRKQEAELAAKYDRLSRAMTANGLDWHALSLRTVDAVGLGTDKRQAIPALCVLLREEEWFGVAGTQIGSSAGAAAQYDAEQARIAALLELAEHDAVGIWWFNRLAGHRVELTALSGAAEPLRRWLMQRARQTCLLRLPTDLPACVVAAASAKRDGGWVAYGFGARLSLEEAALAAILEMLQCELSLSAMARRYRNVPDAAENVPPLLQWSARSRLEDIVRFPETPDAPAAPSSAAALETALMAHGTYVADITRDDIGVPAVRAISTSLRDWTPRFAPGRLYTVPTNLGLASRPLSEDDLNADRIVI